MVRGRSRGERVRIGANSKSGAVSRQVIAIGFSRDRARSGRGGREARDAVQAVVRERLVGGQSRGRRGGSRGVSVRETRDSGGQVVRDRPRKGARRRADAAGARRQAWSIRF